MSSFPLALKQQFLTSGPYARYAAEARGEFVMPGQFPLGNKLSDPTFHSFQHAPSVSSEDSLIGPQSNFYHEPATPETLNRIQAKDPASAASIKASKRERYITELAKGRGASSLGEEVPESRSIEDAETANQIARMAQL